MVSPFTVQHDKNENEFDHDVCKGKEIILKIKYLVKIMLERTCLLPVCAGD